MVAADTTSSGNLFQWSTILWAAVYVFGSQATQRHSSSTLTPPITSITNTHLLHTRMRTTESVRQELGSASSGRYD